MMEARLLLCCLVLGGLVGTMEQALLQINERQDKTPERTSDQKGLSSTKEDETSVGLSKDMLPLKTYTKLIGTKNPKSTLDKAEKRVIRSNYLAFNNSTGNKKCEMEMSRFSLDYFMYSIQRYESNYVFLGLRQANSSSGITIRSKPDVINGDIWIWTFWGKDGAQEFLRWPIEFGIWSMGILYQSVLRHPKVLSVTLKRVSGDCSNLTVGNKDDDLAISNALNGITLALMSNLSDGEKYGPSYYCYTRKRNITEYMKVICENIVCPFEGIEQVCCDYRFNKTKMKRNVICPEYEFMYDTISWMVPIMLAIVLFVYFPILLFFVAYKIFDDPRSTYVPPSLTVQSFKGSDDGCQEEELDGCHTSKMYLLEGYKHVSFFQTLFMPLTSLKGATVTLQTRLLCLVVGRLTRVSFPIVTLSIIGLQAYVDSSNLQSFIRTSVKLGVPYGLRSIITGYEMSRTNFLPFLGGPFVALFCYVVITSVLLMIPKSIPKFLAKGLRPKIYGACANVSETELSPMSESLKNIKRFGSLRSTDNSTGYLLLYRFTVSQVLMVLNFSFWKTSIAIQHARLQRIYNRSGFCCTVIFFPLYFVICAVELVMTFIIYGLPIISFGRLVITSYCSALPLPKRNPIYLILAHFIKLFTFIAVLFFLYMLCAVFLETILFITRICVFSYTAMIFIPKVTYGYLIFYFTVLFYLWEAINDYSLCYDRLFHDSIKAAMYVQRTRRSRGDGLLCKVRKRRGIRQSIFEIIIEEHNPRRRQMTSTCLKLAIIILLMSVAIELLIKADKFKDLHTIMHVGTAIIVCAMPQILKRMCHQRESKLLRIQFRQTLADTILSHLEYVVHNEETSGDSEESCSD